MWNYKAQEYIHLTDQASDPVRHRLLIPEVLELMGPLEGKIVLDAGCGPGWFFRAMAERGARRICGIDSEATMIAHCRSLRIDTVELIEGDIRNSIRDKDRFDVILLILVLHLIEDASSILVPITRSLKPRGKIVIVVPHPCYHFDEHLIEALASRNQIRPADLHYVYSENHEVTGRIGRPPISFCMYHRSTASYLALVSSIKLRLLKIAEPCMPIKEKGESIWKCVPPFLMLSIGRNCI
jgi:trans-aconitate methyltransferase